MKLSVQKGKGLLTIKGSEFLFKHMRIDGKKEITQVKLLFTASKNGWRPKEFHQYCDDKGPTLSLIQSDNDYLSAGFTSKSWQSTDGTDVEDSSAMVFALKNELQVFKTNNPKEAVWHLRDCGPYF